MYYSKTTGGFYDPSINSQIPPDAVAITKQDYSALFAGQGVGKVISSDEQGKPVLTDAAPKVPSVLTMKQARLALLAAGHLDAVNSAVAAMPGAAGDAARIEWEFSSTVERNNHLVAALAPKLGLDAVALDALFLSASAI